MHAQVHRPQACLGWKETPPQCACKLQACFSSIVVCYSCVWPPELTLHKKILSCTSLSPFLPLSTYQVGDVTAKLPHSNGSVGCIIDKGTLDAMDSDDDKRSMLRECSRVLDKQRGVLLSVSFGSVARLKVCFKHKLCTTSA